MLKKICEIGKIIVIWAFLLVFIFCYFLSFLAVLTVDTIEFYEQVVSLFVTYVTIMVGILTAYLVFISLFNKIVFLERLNYYKDKVKYKKTIKVVLFIANVLGIMVIMLLRIIPEVLSNYLLIIYSLLGTICVSSVFVSLGYVIILVINYNQLIKVSNRSINKINDFQLFFLRNSEPEIFRDLILHYDQSRFSLEEHEINKTLINRNFIKYITNNNDNPKTDLRKLIIDLINERTNISIFPHDILNKLLFVYFNDYEITNIEAESNFCDFIVEHNERKNNRTEFIIVESLSFEILHKMFEIKVADTFESDSELCSLKTRWWDSLFFILYFRQLKKLDSEFYYNKIYDKIRYNQHQRQFDLLVLVLTYAVISENEYIQKSLVNMIFPEGEESRNENLNLNSLEGMKYLSFYDGILQETSIKEEWNNKVSKYFNENFFWFMFYEGNEFGEFKLEDLKAVSKNYQNGFGILEFSYKFGGFQNLNSCIASKILEKYYIYIYPTI